MIGYVYIMSSGYDPEHGKNLNDPYLGRIPTLGACMPNIRRQVVEGDQIFFVSGRMRDVRQFIVGGFTVEEKITAMAAFQRFPGHRLRTAENGAIAGNIIVDSRGRHHRLDNHDGFQQRIENYIVGRDPVVLTQPHEIAKGRDETVDILGEVMRKRGTKPFDIIGRSSKLNEEQVLELRHWLSSLKARP
jgi:hypothetical protein